MGRSHGRTGSLVLSGVEDTRAGLDSAKIGDAAGIALCGDGTDDEAVGELAIGAIGEEGVCRFRDVGETCGGRRECGRDLEGRRCGDEGKCHGIEWRSVNGGVIRFVNHM